MSGRNKPSFLGAAHDLERLVKTHLFVICPNNSGSTFIKEALATSAQTWNLAHEGQHTFGFAGPKTQGTRHALIWASRPEFLARYTDSEAYNWEISRQAWYFQATSLQPDASVFVTKSPPFLLQVDAIARAFRNVRFLFMVRDPYAVAEGIRRRHLKIGYYSNQECLFLASRHILHCLEVQKRNVRVHASRSVFFTYEQMCDTPSEVEHKIRSLVPVLEDLRLDQRLRVKGIYNERLQNMNDRQIERLSKEDLKELNAVFTSRQDLLGHFGYDLLVPE